MSRSQIIKDLANSKIDAYTALKRTKVLLKKLNNSSISDWVNNEIDGYLENEKIPDYRKVTGQLYGSYIQCIGGNNMSFENVPLSLEEISDEEQNSFQNENIRDSILTLEDDEKAVELSNISIPEEIYSYIEQNHGGYSIRITSAYIKIGKSQILDIVPKVENILLDILCYLEDQFGNLDDLDIDVNNKNNKELNEIQQQILIFIYDGHKITIGDNNTIKNSTIDS